MLFTVHEIFLTAQPYRKNKNYNESIKSVQKKNVYSKKREIQQKIRWFVQTTENWWKESPKGVKIWVQEADWNSRMLIDDQNSLWTHTSSHNIHLKGRQEWQISTTSAKFNTVSV